ncbi:hypothetical protein C8J57DRAFT_1724339 [Mycena rebaudengoi]|nr:hypothetical protein C8J57DRAFT_1724339 [Mycena rebaudengoi]
MEAAAGATILLPIPPDTPTNHREQDVNEDENNRRISAAIEPFILQLQAWEVKLTARERAVLDPSPEEMEYSQRMADSCMAHLPSR